MARHGYVTKTGYFFYSMVRGIQVVPRQDLSQQTVRSQVYNDVVVFGHPHMGRRSPISLLLSSCLLRATFSMKFSAFNSLFGCLHELTSLKFGSSWMVYRPSNTMVSADSSR